MNVIEGQYSYFKNGTVDRLNDLARRASQKVQTNSIVDLYTQSPIFRINPKNLFMGYKEFDEQANLLRQANYAYDALGRRIEKIVTDLQVPENNKTRRYVYDGEDILLVLNENNEELSKYTHSSLRIDDALSIDDKVNNKSYYFLKDHLGSIVDIVNDDLSFKQHYAYSSFGELQKVTDIGGSDITSSPLLEHHFAYTGREYDQESGLYHYRARAYDASTGRFLQVDPHPGVLKNPTTVNNKYNYANNNPNLFLDPSGEFIVEAMVIGAIVGVVVNELFDLKYSAFEAALIGAAAGALTAYVLEGMFVYGSTMSTSSAVATGFSVGLVAGSIAGVAMATAIGVATNDKDDRTSLDDAVMIGALSGAFAGAITAGYPEWIHNQIYGRLLKLSQPMSYMNSYPSDVLAVSLYAYNELLCKNGKVSGKGGSCIF